MCSSLYEPNEELLDFYNGFKVAKLKEKKEIETITLDDFINKEKIEDIDFIKIDVQGAELDVLKGATNTIKNVLKIVCEVEFIPAEITFFGRSSVLFVNDKKVISSISSK